MLASCDPGSKNEHTFCKVDTAVDAGFAWIKKYNTCHLWTSDRLAFNDLLIN